MIFCLSNRHETTSFVSIGLKLLRAQWNGCPVTSLFYRVFNPATDSIAIGGSCYSGQDESLARHAHKHTVGFLCICTPPIAERPANGRLLLDPLAFSSTFLRLVAVQFPKQSVSLFSVLLLPMLPPPFLVLLG